MYTKYKSTGTSYIPSIPFGWAIKSGRFCFEENSLKNSDLSQRNLLQFTYGSIVRKKNQDIPTDSEDIYRKYTQVCENDIMLNGLNLNYDFVSQRVGLVREEGIITSAYLALRCHDIIIPQFANYLLKSLDAQKIFHGMGSGVRLTLGYSEFSRMLFPVPPHEEQDQIVRYLNWQISHINKLIHGHHREIKLLEERKLFIINTAITKGLDPNIEYKSVDSNWTGDIPEHWDFGTIKQHFRIQKRIAGKEGYDIISITQQGLKVKDVSSNEGQIAASYTNYQLVYPGDFAMNHMDLLTGYVGVSDKLGVTSPDYRVFSLEDVENCDPKYYLYIFQLGYKRRIFYGLGKGAASKGRWRMPAINFKNFEIPIPPIDEQREIVRYIEAQEKKINELITGIEKLIDLLKEYRTRLISDVVTGQIDVRSIEIPEYEPENDTDEQEAVEDEEADV